MYGFYRKNPLGFALCWIGIYCFLQSLGNLLGSRLPVPEAGAALLALGQALFLLFWLKKQGLFGIFGLRRPQCPAKNMLYYLPLALLSTSNLWLGPGPMPDFGTLAVHLLLMASVGLLEELIFRGFLFEALARKNLRSAVLISSLTFGTGHLLNLFNGRHMAEVLPQVLMAVLFGLLFVMIYLRSGSLIPSIVSHGAINILSIFADRTRAWHPIVTAAELILVLLYLGILSKTAPILRKS